MGIILSDSLTSINNGFTTEIFATVDDLPATGVSGTIYLVGSEEPYEAYVWVDSLSAYTSLGANYQLYDTEEEAEAASTENTNLLCFFPVD